MSRKREMTNRLLCYPLMGPVAKQYSTLLGVLSAVETDANASENLVGWMERKFKISNSYARKVCSIIFGGMGLVVRKAKRHTLTAAGQEVLRTRDPDMFYRRFSQTYFAVDVILEILAVEQPAHWDVLHESWAANVLRMRSEAGCWSKQHLRNQLRFRLDWLRSLNLVDFLAGRYYLSSEGSQMRRNVLETAAGTTKKKQEITHSDIEDKLSLIGAFFQFDVKKRAKLNDILPKSSQLKENRQVDSLWVRFVHFGGKLQYPFEVQLSGSMADAIERLEMVANVVQKAVVVTDGEQMEKMLDRLKVKRSALLDKIVFLEPAEVEKIVEATVVMKSFTQAIFGE